MLSLDERDRVLGAVGYGPADLSYQLGPDLVDSDEGMTLLVELEHLGANV